MAPSCTEVLTLSSTKDDLRLVFAHAGQEYLDPACLPIGTKEPSELQWNTYYCTSPSKHPVLSSHHHAPVTIHFLNERTNRSWGPPDSPAICPHSWTPAQTFTSLTWGFGSVRIDLGTETTAVLCCPSGYDKGGYGHACTSKVAKDQTLHYVNPRQNGTVWDRGEIRPTVIETATFIHGDGVPIWWQDKDKEVLDRAAQMTPSALPQSSGSLVAGNPTEGASSVLPENTNSSTPGQSQSSSSSSGLSTGAKIGLGVGIPLAILLGLALGYILFRRRTKRKIAPPANGGYEMGNGSGVVGGGGMMQNKEIARHELKSDPVYELDDEAARKVELPTSRA
jgi:hypothetical protein